MVVIDEYTRPYLAIHVARRIPARDAIDVFADLMETHGILNGEIFYTPREAQVLSEQWRVHYNTIRPHSALGYRPPAPDIILPGEELPMNHEAA